MIFRESGDAVRLFFFSLAALMLSFLSVSFDLVERVYQVLGCVMPEKAIDLFFNFMFLVLAGLIFFCYRRWRASEAARGELDDIVESINPDVVIVIDRDRRIRICNSAVMRMFGLHADEVIGKKTDCLYRDRRTTETRAREIYHALEQEGFHVGEATGVRREGGEFPVEIIASALRQGRGAVLLIRDITARKDAEAKVIRVRDFYRSLFDEFPVPIRFCNNRAEGVAFNRSWLGFTGRPLEKEMGSQWMEGVFPEDRPKVEAMWRRLVETKQPGELVYRLRRHDGEYRWIIEYVRAYDDTEGNQSGFISACYDTTERVVQERQLAYMATHDPLTDLPNRVLFADRLRQAMAEAERTRKLAVLIFLDLDGFKDVNDNHGHDVGDLLLKSVAERLSACTRLGDTIARFGGDEFVVLLPRLDSESFAAAVADRVCSSFSQPFSIRGNDIFITASLGLSVYPSDGKTVDTLMTLADSAMYRAKEMGKNRSQFFDARHNALLRSAGGVSISLVDDGRSSDSP